MHAVCVGACLLGADFLANSAGNREHSRFRYAWAVGNRPEWERGESEPRAKTGLAAGGDATMNLLTACMHLVTRADKKPRRPIRQATAKAATHLHGGFG